jgi:hypothetical protein
VLDPSMLDSASLRRLGKQKKVCWFAQVALSYACRFLH